MTTTKTIASPDILCRRFGMPGMVFNIRLSNAESNGRIVIADFEGVPGCEPPRHVHTLEDEIFMIKEGTITLFIGEDIVQAGPGDTVFLPRNVAHHFSITSHHIKATVIATPGNIEHFFRSICQPHEAVHLPPLQIPTQEEINYFVQQTEAFGMQFV